MGPIILGLMRLLTVQLGDLCLEHIKICHSVLHLKMLKMYLDLFTHCAVSLNSLYRLSSYFFHKSLSSDIYTITWQEYTEELYKKDLHDTGDHDGLITGLEPDILECEAK